MKQPIRTHHLLTQRPGPLANNVTAEEYADGSFCLLLTDAPSPDAVLPLSAAEALRLGRALIVLALNAEAKA